MSEPAAVSARLIGEIFVERGLITHEQLAQALELQREGGGMLGEILVGSFGVSRIELAGVLAEQWSAMERGARSERGEPAVAAAPPPTTEEAMEELSRRPIGEIFVERGMVTEEQLEHALQIQRESGERLGEILVRLGVIGRLELAGALAEQWSGLQKLRPPAPKKADAWSEPAPQPPQPSSALADISRIDASITSLQEQLAALASRPDPDLTSLRAVTRALADRVEGVEKRLHGLPATETLFDIAGAIAGLEESIAAAVRAEELDELRRATDETTRAIPPRLDSFAADIASLAARVDSVVGSELLVLRGEVAGTRSTLETLADRVEHLGGELGNRADGTSTVAEQLAEETRALHARIGDLEAAIASAATEAQALDALPVMVDDLLARLTRIETVTGAGVARHDEIEPHLAELRTRLHEIEERFGALADTVARGPAEHAHDVLESELHERPTRDELETALSEQAARIDRLRTDDLTALTQRLDAVEHAAAGTVPVADLTALAERVAAVEQRGAERTGAEELEALRTRVAAVEHGTADAARGTELAALAGDLTAQLDHLRHALDAARADSAQALDASVLELRGWLEAVQARLEDGAGRAELAALAGDLGARVDGLAGQLAGLPAAPSLDLSSLYARLDDLSTEITDRVTRREVVERATAIDTRLDELSSALAEREEPERDTSAIDEVRRQLEVLEHALDTTRSELTARIEATPHEGWGHRLAELDARLHELGERLTGAPSARALDELTEDVSARLESLRADLDLDASSREGRVGSLETGLDELRNAVAGLRELGTTETTGRLEAIIASHDARIASLPTHSDLQRVSGSLADRLAAIEAAQDVAADLPTREDLHETAGRLEARLAGLESAGAGIDERLAGLPTHEHLQNAVADIHTRLEGTDRARAELVHRLGELSTQEQLSTAVEHLEGWLRASDGARDELAHRLAGVLTRDELRATVDALEARLLATAGHGDVDRLTAALEGLADEVRGGLAGVHARVDELAAGHGHLGGRLAAAEQAAASAAADTVVSDLESLRAEVFRQAALSDERATATDKAIRKGLAALAERLVASEAAYLEAGSALRRSVERLGAAVVEADARLAGEPLDPPAGGYVAFLPTSDGYRLTAVAGAAPAVDELVEIVPGEPPYRVVRATLSPLPLDRRVCVYLERI